MAQNISLGELRDLWKKMSDALTGVNGGRVPVDFDGSGMTIQFPETQEVNDVAAKAELEAIKDALGGILSIKAGDTDAELALVKQELTDIKTRLEGTLTTELTGSYVGYSTDDKSTIAPNAKRGDSFLELDTKDIYFFDGSDWVVW